MLIPWEVRPGVEGGSRSGGAAQNLLKKTLFPEVPGPQGWAQSKPKGQGCRPWKPRAQGLSRDSASHVQLEAGGLDSPGLASPEDSHVLVGAGGGSVLLPVSWERRTDFNQGTYIPLLSSHAHRKGHRLQCDQHGLSCGMGGGSIISVRTLSKGLKGH